MRTPHDDFVFYRSCLSNLYRQMSLINQVVGQIGKLIEYITTMKSKQRGTNIAVVCVLTTLD